MRKEIIIQMFLLQMACYLVYGVCVVHHWWDIKCNGGNTYLVLLSSTPLHKLLLAYIIMRYCPKTFGQITG